MRSGDWAQSLAAEAERRVLAGKMRARALEAAQQGVPRTRHDAEGNLAAAAARDLSNVPSRRQPQQQASAGVSGGSRQPGQSEQQRSDLSGGPSWVELMQRDTQRGLGIGPVLRELKEEQRREGRPSEEYSLVHAERLYLYPARRQHAKESRVLCSRMHGTGCSTCVSCHSCRNKYVGKRTFCRNCYGVRDQVAGPNRGLWCGNCLWTRMGENIDELPDDWLCPCCRDICNCSATNCKRAMRGWLPTNTLSHEATRQGYTSSAHYLILNHLTETARAAALGAGAGALPKPATGPWQQLAAGAEGEMLDASRKRKRGLLDPLEQRKQLLEEATVPWLQAELERALAELGADPEALGLGNLSEAGVLDPAGSGRGGSRARGSAGAFGAASGEDEGFPMAEMLARDLEGEGDEEDEEDEEGSGGGAIVSTLRDWSQRVAARARAPAARPSPEGAAAGASALQPRMQPAALPPAPAAASGPAGSLSAGPAVLSELGMAAGSGGSAAASHTAAASSRWQLGLPLPERLPSQPHQRPAGLSAPYSHPMLRPLAAPALPLSTPALAAGGAPMLPSLRGALQHPVPKPLLGANEAVALPRESSRSPSDSHAASGTAAGGPARAAAGGAAAPGPEAARQREELEALLPHDTADGLHAGVPYAGNAATAPQRQRAAAPAAPRGGGGGGSHNGLPAQQGQQQRAQLPHHLTPHLSRQATFAAAAAGAAGAAAPKAQQLLTTSGAEAAAPAQRSPIDRASEGSPGAEAVGGDVADPSGQLRLPSAEDPAAPSARTSPDPGPGLVGASSGPAALRSASLPAASPSGQQASALQPPLPPAAKAISLLPSHVTPPGPADHAALAVGATRPQEMADARAWDGLYTTLDTAYARCEALFHASNGTGPPVPEGQDLDTLYQQARGALLQLAQRQLSRAERKLCDAECSVGIPAAEGSGASGPLFSTLGLSSCLHFYNFLVTILPPERDGDVRFVIQRRLLAQESFVDFALCELVPRKKLLDGWLELLFGLHTRGMELGDCLSAISGAVALMGEELAEAKPLLDILVKILNKQEAELPPDVDSIGPWRLQRDRDLLVSFKSLFFFVNFLPKLVLVPMLKAVQTLFSPAQLVHKPNLPNPVDLAVQATGLLTPEVVHALLRPDKRLGSPESRLAAFETLCKALTAVSASDADARLGLTPNQLAARRAARARLCDVLETNAVPLLEGMMRQEYPLWRPARQPAQAVAAVALPVGFGEGEVALETRGLAKVETLAHCFGFLVANGRMRWEDVEKAVACSYSFPNFWHIATHAYRTMALFMLAMALERAGPSVLMVQANRDKVLRVWVGAVLEKGKRLGAQQLTRVLASSPATAPLFAGVSAEQLEAVSSGPGGGEVRRQLLVSVIATMAASNSWARELGPVLEDLPKVLEARSKEVRDRHSAFVLAQWQVEAAQAVVGMLRAVPLHGPGRPDVPCLGQLRSLLAILAKWAVHSCDTQRRLEGQAAASEAGVGPAAVQARSSEELRSHARGNLKATVFGRLEELWGLLLAWSQQAGLRQAPEAPPAQAALRALGSEPDLLRPLWTVVTTCLEACSGAEEPGPTDTVALQMLAQSLSSQLLAPLREFVLATFVRLYLERSKIPHVSNERAAVNALRMLGALLGEASMRSAGATFAALRLVIPPLLDVLRPSTTEAPSLAAKEAVYSMLKALLSDEHGALAALVPPYWPPLSPPQPQPQQQAQQQREQVMQCFLGALALDVLECVKGALAGPGAAAGKVAQLLAHNGLQQRVSRSPTPLAPSALLPPSAAGAAHPWHPLKNRLQEADLLGLPLPPGPAFEQRLAELGKGLALGPGAGGAAMGATSGRPAPFRPANYGWALAIRAVECMEALARLPSSSGGGSGDGGSRAEGSPGAPPAGAIWAMACLPALHYLIIGTGAHCHKDLRSAYLQLRAAVTERLGEAALAPFPLKTQAPPAGAQQQQAVRPALSQAVTQCGEHQPGRSAPMPPPRPVARPAAAQPSQSVVQQPRPANGSRGSGSSSGRPEVYTADQPLCRVSQLNRNAVLPLTAVLYKEPREPKGPGGPLLLLLRDFASGGGRCTVVVKRPELVEQIRREAMSGSYDWGAASANPLVVRLSEARLLAATNGENNTPTLVDTGATTVQFRPQTEYARELAAAARERVSPAATAALSQAPPPLGSALLAAAVAQPATQHGTPSALTPRFHHSDAWLGPGSSGQPDALGKRPDGPQGLAAAGPVGGPAPKRPCTGGDSGGPAASLGPQRLQPSQLPSASQGSVLQSQAGASRSGAAGDHRELLLQDALRLLRSMGYSVEPAKAALKRVFERLGQDAWPKESAEQLAALAVDEL